MSSVTLILSIYLSFTVHIILMSKYYEAWFIFYTLCHLFIVNNLEFHWIAVIKLLKLVAQPFFNFFSLRLYI